MVVLVGVVVLVAAVVGGGAVVAVPAAALVVEDALPEPPDELPHAASSTMSGSRARRFMSTSLLGMRAAACHYPDGHGP